MVAEVTHRVFFQPSGIDANPASPSFCLDFWTYRYVSKPLPAAKGGGFSKPARSARVTLYKAARSKVCIHAHARLYFDRDLPYI